MVLHRKSCNCCLSRFEDNEVISVINEDAAEEVDR